MDSVRPDMYQPDEVDAEKHDIQRRDKKLLRKRKRNEKRENGISAENAEQILKNLANFGGIFYADQLENVKILDLPVSLLILDDCHWISIFIGEKSLEIMDSAGFTTNEDSNKHLLRFLCAHSYGKVLTSTPQLQDENSSDCGKYAISFLCTRNFTNLHLKDFAKIFSNDFELNSEIIDDIFNTIQKLFS